MTEIERLLDVYLATEIDLRERDGTQEDRDKARERLLAAARAAPTLTVEERASFDRVQKEFTSSWNRNLDDTAYFSGLLRLADLRVVLRLAESWGAA